MDTVANIANNLLSRQDAAVTAALVSGTGSFASPPAESTSRVYTDLPITTHFCSSCKKRMPFEAFHRRQNGNLYNTCISCLNRTKLKKVRNDQNKTASTRITTERLPRELSISLSPPVSSAEANNQISGLGLRRVPTSTSNHSSNVDDFMATSIASTDVGGGGGLVPMQQLPLRLTLSTQPPSSPLALPTTIPHSENNDEEEEAAEHGQEDTHSTKRPRLAQPDFTTSPPPQQQTSVNSSGVFIPDSYVQLEYQRLELEKQRLALEQERWREERAERMRWEQMYREQWQEEREERKAFREREQYIWKIMLALRGATQAPSTSN